MGGRAQFWVGLGRGESVSREQGRAAGPLLLRLFSRVASLELASGAGPPASMRRDSRHRHWFAEGAAWVRTAADSPTTMRTFPCLRGPPAPPPLPLVLLCFLAAARPSLADGHAPGVTGAGRRRGLRAGRKGRGRCLPASGGLAGAPRRGGVGERREDAGGRRWTRVAASSLPLATRGLPKLEEGTGRLVFLRPGS